LGFDDDNGDWFFGLVSFWRKGDKKKKRGREKGSIFQMVSSIMIARMMKWGHSKGWFSEEEEKERERCRGMSGEWELVSERASDRGRFEGADRRQPATATQRRRRQKKDDDEARWVVLLI
jgi:hypothetical protein